MRLNTIVDAFRVLFCFAQEHAQIPFANDQNQLLKEQICRCTRNGTRMLDAKTLFGQFCHAMSYQRLNTAAVGSLDKQAYVFIRFWSNIYRLVQ